MIIIITGGRNFNDENSLFTLLDHYRFISEKAILLFEGGASGADSLAAKWTKLRENTPGQLIFLKEVLADWNMIKECKHHLHSFKDAGPCRNKRMLELSLNILTDDRFLLACPGNKGTENCIKQAKIFNIEVKYLYEELEKLDVK